MPRWGGGHQVRTLYMERFPSEFRLGPVAEVILPSREGLPCVRLNRKLHCPILSACNVLKAFLKCPGKLKDVDHRALMDLNNV